MDEYQARIHAEERMEAVMVFANQVKNLIAKSHVTEKDAFKILCIPDKYHEDILNVLDKAK